VEQRNSPALFSKTYYNLLVDRYILMVFTYLRSRSVCR